MIPSRRYGAVSHELRAAAVDQVRELSPRVASRWRAIQLVAETLHLHPNTVRSWVDAAPDPIPTSRRDTDDRTEHERALQLAAQADIIATLSRRLGSSP